MKKNIKNEIKYIEEWSLSKIINEYDIAEYIDGDEHWLCNIIDDLYATYPASIFRTLPNYARLKVIVSLDWLGLLSMDNIHYVESELRNVEEAYENYDWYIIDTARKIKRNRGALNV